VPIAPVFLLAILIVLLGTQVAYLIAPRSPHFLVRLGLSTLAVLIGEGLGLLGVGPRLNLGELHPVNDLALLALLQWAGSRWIGREQPV
jgi:hypothetical protein